MTTRIVSVAGACSRSGKTALAVTLLRALAPRTAVAVKFTTTEDVFKRCPRGTACLVCDIDVPFRIIEDRRTLDEPGTDTERLGHAGAARVVWAIARASAVGEAWADVRRRIQGAELVVMEGSTIVGTARPDLMAFVVHPFLSTARWKSGAQALIAAADAVIVNVPGTEQRPPAAAVLRELESLCAQSPPMVADVARPLEEWAPGLFARLHELAPQASVPTGAGRA